MSWITGNQILTLDFDSFDHEQLILDIFRNLYQEKRVVRVWKRLSSSKNGYHYKIELAIPEFMLDNVDPHHVEDHVRAFKWSLRYLLGEDYGRLKIDSFRIKEKLKEEILFFRKDGNDVEQWERLL